MRSYFVYILASGCNGTLYICVTNNIKRRIHDHREGLVEGFTKKYQVKQLVFFEETTDINSALQKEKQLKNWKRQWKIELIEKDNPNWSDLFYNLE